MFDFRVQYICLVGEEEAWYHPWHDVEGGGTSGSACVHAAYMPLGAYGLHI